MNHWIPDARAKRVGVVERRTPLTAPKRRPDAPGVGVSWGVHIACQWEETRDGEGGRKQVDERLCLRMNQSGE